ncbi:MAG: asparaginase [Ruminococcus sp.]|nr:asparaginase [Ruminococcus sp.]
MKILVVFTGGTISCTQDNGILSTDESNSYLLIDMYNRLDSSVKFEMLSPYTILSENLCGDNLMMLYNAINNYDISQFDGIIVTHGTDTLQYTSAFLGYAFSDCNLPIVVVSANYPLADNRSNGFDNFCAAINFIRSGKGWGVFVAYKNGSNAVQIHRATRLLAHNAYSDNLHSVFDVPFGYIERGEFVADKNYTESKNEFIFDTISISSSNDIITVKSGVDIIYPQLNSNIKAVLMEGFHSGTLATNLKSLQNFCTQAKQLEIPIFLTGICSGFEYESKQLFDELSICSLPSAAPIAMELKLRLLNKDNIRNVFLPCGGDFA